MEHDEMFNGKTIVGFKANSPLPDPANYAVCLSAGDYSFYADDDNLDFDEVLALFLAKPDVANIDTLVIGHIPDCGMEEDEANLFLSHKQQLPNLHALFVGNVSQEENEISWIPQLNYTNFLNAFPDLTCLKIRGYAAFPELKHDKLQTLIVESGGLGKEAVRQLLAADLPALTHLELWLGSEDYGNDCTVDDLAPLFAGEKFKKLSYLGLRNADNINTIAAALANTPIVKQLTVLDLSLGALTDEGGQALLDAELFGHLELLDLHYHYLSSKMMEKFAALPIKVNLAEQLAAEDYGDDELYYPIFVSE